MVRRGNVAIVLAVLLTTLLGVAALVIDLGYRRLMAEQLQNAADAAALAAAVRLAEEGPAAARALAISIAGANGAGGSPIALAEADVEIGSWDATTRAFVVDEDDGDVVRVTARVDDPAEFFAGALGWGDGPIARRAIAAAGEGPAVCGFFSILEMTVSGNPWVESSVCSNANVTISGNVTLEGGAYSGPGDEVRVSGSNQIGGSIGELPEDLSIAWPSTAGPWNNSRLSCPSGASNCRNTSSDLSLSGPRQINLSAGSYRWRNISTAGQARINITSGPVYIYASGSCSLAGQGVLNTTANPDNLVMFCNGDASLSGNAGWYGTLYSRGNIQITGGGSRWAFDGMAMAGGTMKIAGNVDLYASGSVSEEIGGDDGPRLVY